MRENEFRNIVKVGIFVSILTFVFMTFIVFIGKETTIFDSTTKIRAHLTNAQLLQNGTFVQLKGIKIGFVERVFITEEEKVEVTLKIKNEYLKWIRKDSQVSVNTAGLVGDKFVEISTGTAESPVFHPEMDILEASGAFDMKSFAAKGESAVEKMASVLARLDHILASLEEDQKLSKAITNLSSASKSIGGTMEQLNKVLKRVEQGPGSVHSLVYDDVLHEELRTLLGGAQRNEVIKYFIRQSIKSSDKNKK
ncbi:MAG: MCE family protein [Bacteriovoracaceae bacterium]|nr:MCE family protein [Bacteriovoracaceae bacterium]